MEPYENFFTIHTIYLLGNNVCLKNISCCPGFTDIRVIQLTVTVSGLVTGLNVAVEILTKSLTGEAHIGTSSHYVYMGAKSEDLSSTPWLISLTLGQILALTISLVVYKILKYRLEKKLI